MCFPAPFPERKHVRRSEAASQAGVTFEEALKVTAVKANACATGGCNLDPSILDS